MADLQHFMSIFTQLKRVIFDPKTSFFIKT